MASFIIAVLVGGLNLILAAGIAFNIAKPAIHRPDPHSPFDASPTADVKTSVGGGVAQLICLNCMSVPLCLVGVGLAIVGLVVNRDGNHLFTWIGLLVNGMVVLAVVGMQVLGALLGG
jgi:hypothetical protein